MLHIVIIELWDRAMIFVFVGIVFVVLNAMKVYVYMRFFRHSVLLPRWLGIAILVFFGFG